MKLHCLPGRLAWSCLALLGLLASAQAAGPFEFVPLTPCRLIDTSQIGEQPLQSATARTLFVRGLCGVPVGATAVSVTFTVQPGKAGRLLATATGVDTSSASFPAIFYFGKRDQDSNSAIVALDDQGRMDLRAPTTEANGTTHIQVDVTGYFQPVAR